MDVRVCGWCEVSIGHMQLRARYCCLQHKKNAASKRHRERNPSYYRDMYRTEARRAAVKANYLATGDAKRAYGREQQRRYREEHPDAARIWWANNKIKHVLYQANRRAKMMAGPGITERDWSRLIRRYDSRCAYCGVMCDPPHMDHVVPLKRGGQHSIGNILPACKTCNSSKNAELLVVWRQR